MLRDTGSSPVVVANSSLNDFWLKQPLYLVCGGLLMYLKAVKYKDLLRRSLFVDR